MHNHFNHTIAVFQHFMVGKTQNGVTMRLQPSCPCSITRHLIVAAVLVAIQLDNQFSGGAKEIGDISA